MSYDVNTVSAARLWEYEPDWSQGFELRRAFLTDITASRNNTEKRRALRNVPRLSASYSTLVDGDDYQAAKHFLRAWQNEPTAVIDFSRYAATTGASLATDSALTLASPPAWIAAGQLAVLCASDGTHELIEIDSVADPVIDLVDPLVNAWPSGSIIRPVIFGLLNGRLSSQRPTRGAASIGVSVSAYPGGEPPEDQGAAGTTFNGYEVFVPEADFSRQPSLDYLWPVELVDYSLGRTAQFRPIDLPQKLIEASFAGLTPSEAESIEQTFLRSKGMHLAFYRPSGEKDMTLAANTAAVARFDALGSSLVDDFGSFDWGENPTAIEICMIDGTRYHKLITGITASAGNSRVAFAGALTLTTATVARISWMPLVRFASDELATIWQTPIRATISASFQTVRQ